VANYKSDQTKIGNIYGWHVYLIRETGASGFVKIGSASRVEYRLASLRSGNPRRLELVKSWHLDNREQARGVELAVLKNLDGYRLPASEWFQCRAGLVAATVDETIIHLGATIRTNTDPRWS
jgi:hypothetical protein